MVLDRWIALIIALVFLIYGYTAFVGMDDLLPPILKRNPIWPSTFPKILSVIGVLAAIVVVLNVEKSEKQVGDDMDIAKWRDYRLFDAVALIAGMVALCSLPSITWFSCRHISVSCAWRSASRRAPLLALSSGCGRRKLRYLVSR